MKLTRSNVSFGVAAALGLRAAPGAVRGDTVPARSR